MKIKIHEIDLEKRLKLFAQRFPTELKSLKEFLKLLSLGEINKGKAIGETRQRKYVDMLTIFLTNIKKSIPVITKTDMQDFILKLQQDKICKSNSQPYSELTKQDIKITLRIYLKWRLPKKYDSLTGWFDTRTKKKSPEYLPEQEVEKLFRNCRDESSRFLICMLFDGGFRIEEFLNIRFEDIEPPTQNFPYYKITIKDEYSKTEGRTIGLYWKHSTEAIKEYLQICEAISMTAPVFKKDYDAVRMFISRLGKRVLGKRVYPHLLRKSSATYYANLDLGREKLCIRYGWKFSSDMVDIYIKRSGIKEEQVKEKIVNLDLVKLEKENNELKTKIGLVQDEMQEISLSHETQINSLMKGLDFLLSKAEFKNPKQQKEIVELSVKDKRKSFLKHITENP